MTAVLIIFVFLCVVWTAFLAGVLRAAARSTQTPGELAPTARVWQSVATELNGSSARGIDAVVRGVPVLAQVVQRESPRELATRVTAPSRARQSRLLKIGSRKLLHGGAEPPAAQVVELGDALFDAHYFVTSNDKSWARLWLGKNVRRAVGKVPQYHFTIDDGEVRAERLGVEEDAATLTHVIQAVASISRGSRRLERAWTRLAHRLGGRCKRVGDVGAQLEAQVDGVPVRMGIQEIDGEAYTRIHASGVGAKLEPFVLTRRALPDADRVDADVPNFLAGYRLATDDAQSVRTHFTDETIRDVQRLNALEIRLSSTNVVVTLEGVILRPLLLLRGLRLAAALARGASGPYR